ncbi:MarR family transcriptional regulator [Streptacidiphilus sp. N1-10]|uniref:MarR family transcriptional regulator n=1 Tax=Streptacidiphilus jeojiensis TaxID=3229225 RepID=A0ABV6XFT8_9ACTN
MTTAGQEPPQHRLGEATRAYQAAVDDFDRELAHHFGVNETDLRCLEILLQELPEASPSQLADRLGLTTGSTTALLDRLERAGYLARRPHPTDRRKSIVRATPTFQQSAYAVMAPLVDEGHRMIADAFTPDQIATIADFLQRATELQQRHVQQLRSLPRMRGNERAGDPTSR